MMTKKKAMELMSHLAVTYPTLSGWLQRPRIATAPEFGSKPTDEVWEPLWRDPEDSGMVLTYHSAVEAFSCTWYITSDVCIEWAGRTPDRAIKGLLKAASKLEEKLEKLKYHADYPKKD